MLVVTSAYSAQATSVRGRRQGLRLEVRSPADLSDKLPRQRRDVLAAMAERGQIEPKHGQLLAEIRVQPAFVHPRVDARFRGSHRSDIERHDSFARHQGLAVPQEVPQLHLAPRWQVDQMTEEQRASPRPVQRARLRDRFQRRGIERWSPRPVSETEQLQTDVTAATHTIEGHERTAAVAALFVNQARQAFAACPPFTA